MRALSVLVAVCGLMALAVPAWAPPLKKDFNVCGGVAPSCASPAAVPIGTAVPLTIVISSVPRAGSPLGSANITLPEELVIVGGPTDPVVPAGKDWTASLNGQTIELRNPGSGSENTLTGGQSVSVTVTVDAQCLPPRAPIGVTVRTSNDFSGGDLVGDGLPYLIGCTPPAADHLAFGQQPTDTISGQAMDPVVTVRVEDSSNNLITSFSGTVSLALGSNPDAATLFGGGPVTVSGGIATFEGLVVSKPTTGTTSGFTLVATSDPAVTSATSSAFAVTGMSDICEFETCTANSGNLGNASPDDNWIGRATVETGECVEGNCFLSVFESADCPEGFDCKTNLFVFIPPSNQTGLLTVQIACDSSICPNVGPPGGTDPVFKQLEDGTVVALERCHNSPPSGEDLIVGCITEIIRTRPGDTVYTIVFPQGDPAIFK